MRLFLAALSCMVASVASGQAPAVTQPPTLMNHSVGLDVQSVGNGGKSTLTRGGSKTTSGATSDGNAVASVTSANDKRESKSQTNLQIAVRNLSPAPDTITVEWYFTAVKVASPSSPGGKEYLFDHGTKDVAVGGGGIETFTISSKEAVSVVKRQSRTAGDGAVFAGGVSTVGKSSVSGTAMRGWFVRLTAGGRVLAVRGSSQTYEDIAKDQTKVNALAASK